MLASVRSTSQCARIAAIRPSSASRYVATSSVSTTVPSANSVLKVATLAQYGPLANESWTVKWNSSTGAMASSQNAAMPSLP
jgi:hypothetical protein